MFEKINENKENFPFTDYASHDKLPNRINDYLSYYSYPTKANLYSGGYVQYGQENIWLQSFLPKQFDSVCLLIHGFCDHSGTFSKVIEKLLDSNIAVYIYDQQGFGLSSGARGQIDSFHQYSKTLGLVLDHLKKNHNQDVYVVGHSMGCAVIYDLFLKGELEEYVQKIVLVAPLIRSRMWLASKALHFVLKKFVLKIKRKMRKVSGDQAFLDFLSNEDHLQPKDLYVKWVAALFNWEAYVSRLDKIKNQKKILILQGGKDSTVEGEFNVAFLNSKITDVEIKLYPDGYHHLLNDSEPVKSLVYQDFLSFLAKG